MGRFHNQHYLKVRLDGATLIAVAMDTYEQSDATQKGQVCLLPETRHNDHIALVV